MRMFYPFKYGFIGLVLLCAGLALAPALHPDHSGPAQVIDGDTIIINGEKHRLYGVDAAEFGQNCVMRDGAAWPCGRDAARALVKFLEGRTVNCEPRGRDDYRRHVSICYAGKDNLSAWAAREGWAVADHDAPRRVNFSSEEGAARFLRKGIWLGGFDDPADWRQDHQ